MNKENTSKLWKIIQEAGDYLQGQLPEHPNHPKGRNPYAHVALAIKDKFNNLDNSAGEMTLELGNNVYSTEFSIDQDGFVFMRNIKINEGDYDLIPFLRLNRKIFMPQKVPAAHVGITHQQMFVFSDFHFSF